MIGGDGGGGGIQPGNIITMIGKSLYTGVNNISMGIFGLPAVDFGVLLGGLLAVILLIAIFTGFRRKNSFSLQAQKSS